MCWSRIRCATYRPVAQAMSARWFTALGLMLAGLAFVAPEKVHASEGLEEAQAQVVQITGLMTDLRQSLDLAHVQRDSLLDDMDYDLSALIAYVRHEVRYEAYAGVLRGAEGTLVSQAGNALDQALLLATLLREAGADARIVRGRLSMEEATRLVGQMGEARPERDLAIRDPARWNSLNLELAALNPGAGAHSLPALQELPFYRRVHATSDLLEQHMNAAGFELAAASVEGLITGAQDYFWVEMRDAASDPWQPVHPAFRSAAAPPAPHKVLETFADTLPEALQHRIRVEVFIEQRMGDKRITKRVAGPWERPVANLHGQVLSFYNQPNTVVSPLDGGQLDEALSQANLFIPMLHGQPGTAFDLLGQTVDIDSLSMDAFGAAAVIQTVGRKGAEAADALRILGTPADASPAPLMQLSAQWMEFTLLAPGAGERTFRRDLLPETTGAAGEVGLRQLLAVRHDYLATGGRFSETFAAQQLYTRFADVAPAWQQLNSVLYGKLDSAGQPVRLEPSLLPFIALIRSFDAGVGALATGRSYRPSPSLVILYSGPPGEGHGYRGVDIVSHERIVLTKDGSLQLDPHAALRLGIWETAIETLVLPAWSPEVRKTNTFSVFEAAKAQGIGYTLIRSAEEIPAGALESARSQARLISELEAGKLALLPDRVPDGVLMTGWWRIDPVTGQTLGMLSDGRGSEIAEYLVSLFEMAIGLTMAIGKYAECGRYANADQPELQACCLMEAHLGNVGGMGLGGVLGASFGGSVAGLCDTGGILLGQVKSASGKDEPFRCRMLEDPQAMIGSGGVVNTDYMGCGMLQNLP